MDMERVKKMPSAVHVLLAVTASSLTISNLEPKLDVHGSIVTAHDGTYRRFKRSRTAVSVILINCRRPA